MRKFMRVVSSVIIVATVSMIIPPLRFASVNADAIVESNLIETKISYNDLHWCKCRVLDFLADLASIELNKVEKVVKESDKDEALKTEALKNIEETREVIADIKAMNVDERVESNLIETKTSYNDLDWCACEVLDFLADLANIEFNEAEKMVKESDKDEALKAEALKNIEEAREVIADIKAEIAKMKQNIKAGKDVDSEMNDIEEKINRNMKQTTSKVSEIITNF